MKSTATQSAGVDGKLVRTFSYYAAFIGLGLTTSALGPTLPNLAQNTQSQLSEVSILFSASSLGFIVGASQGGRLYDRLPGHVVIAVAVLLMVVASFLTPLAPLLWLLFGVLFLLGLGQSMVDVGCNTLLVWTHRAKVGPYMNALHFFFGVGAFLSPVIIAQLVQRTGGITWAYWTLGLLMLPAMVWLLLLPSPAIRHQAEEGAARQVNLLLVGLVALFYFLYVGAEVSFGGWIFSYAVTLNLTGETAAAYLTAAFWGALTLGRLLAIPVSIRYRPSTVLNGALLGCLISGAVVVIGGNSLAAVGVGTLGMGLSMAPVFPVTLALAEQRMALTGQITGWFFLGGSLGAMLIPWLIGQFFDTVGPHSAMTIIAATVAMLVVVYGALLFQSNRMQRQ